MVPVVGRLEAQREPLRVLLQHRPGDPRLVELVGREHHVDVDPEREAELQHLLCVVAPGVQLGHLRPAVVHRGQGGVAAGGADEDGRVFAAILLDGVDGQAPEVGRGDLQQLRELDELVDREGVDPASTCLRWAWSRPLGLARAAVFILFRATSRSSWRRGSEGREAMGVPGGRHVQTAYCVGCLGPLPVSPRGEV